MQETLQELATEAVAAEDRAADADDCGALDFSGDGHRISAAEYCALYAVQVAQNFDGIAFAQSEKPSRELDAHCRIPEAPVHVEGETADGAVDNQADGAQTRAALGLGALGQSVAITQSLDSALLQRV